MKTTVSIDAVGRMVLPKPIRDTLGISGPTSVTVEIISGAAQISAHDHPSGPIIRRRGRVIYDGPIPSDWDSGDAVARQRERRLRK